MDRQIVYPGSIPLDTDVLNLERSVMVALGYLAQAVLGTGTIADGLPCTPTSPASMSVAIGPGSITQYGVVDTTPFGSLPAEPNEPLLRIGVSLTSNTFAMSAPTAPGDAINYLIEATLLETDATPVVLPYYNASNPAQPYSGPNNSGEAQNTQRLQEIQIQVKAGAPSTAGTQITPAVDAGWAGLYVVTITAGQTSIGSGNIAVFPQAPFITTKLPQQSPGTRNLAVFTPSNQGNWTAPTGTTTVKLTIWGGGGAGGSGLGGAGGGGGGGGYSLGYYSVTPGESYFVSVGNGGVGSGTPGGASKFGSLVDVNGGLAGANGASGAGGLGGAGGSSAGSGLVLNGQSGGPGFELPNAMWAGGRGGASYGASGAEAIANSGAENGNNASLPGGGGGGGIGSGVGGQGGAGLVLVEW